MKDMATAVGKVLKSIEKIDAFMFYLKIEKGMDSDEISQIAGMSEDSVNKRLKKTYEIVRQELV